MSALQSFFAVCDDKSDCVESVHAFNGTSFDFDVTDRVASVYAFDYEKTEAKDAHSVYDDVAEYDLPKWGPTRKARTSADTNELGILGLITLCSLIAGMECQNKNQVESSLPFFGLAFLCACGFIYNCVDSWRRKALQRRLDEEYDKLNMTKRPVTKPEVDNTETVEADDDIISVYAYDASEIDETVSSDVGADGSSLVTDEAEMDITEDDLTEGNSPFGFTITNPKAGVLEYVTEDYWCTFVNETITKFQTRTTGELLTLVFNGKNLETVEHGGEVYTSFAFLPTKVADLLVTARLVLADFII